VDEVEPSAVFLARFGRNGVRGQGGGLSSLLCSCRHQPRFTTIFQPIALATDVDARRVMEQPVQDRCCDNRISKDRTPVSIVLLEVRMMLPRSYRALTNWKKIVVPRLLRRSPGAWALFQQVLGSSVVRCK
jgi:hypothetical protein